MSVLIKGMEMPKNCFLCRFKNIGICESKEDCPLIEVPTPHGDLIERKAAHDSFLEVMAMTGYQFRALDCIREVYVPTIIPAEEGE